MFLARKTSARAGTHRLLAGPRCSSASRSGPDGARRPPARHRLRQRGEPAARARRRAAKGDCGPARHRRETRARVPPAVTESLVLTLGGAAIGLVLASWAGGLLVAFLATSARPSRARHVARLAPRSASAVGARRDRVDRVGAAAVPDGDARRARGALKETGTAAVRACCAAGRPARSSSRCRSRWRSCSSPAPRSSAQSRADPRHRDTGIDGERLLVVVHRRGGGRLQGRRAAAFHLQLLDRLRDAAGASRPPRCRGCRRSATTMGNWTQSITVDGVLPPAEARYVYFNGVSPGYFATAGMRARSRP